MLKLHVLFLEFNFKTGNMLFCEKASLGSALLSFIFHQRYFFFVCFVEKIRVFISSRQLVMIVLLNSVVRTVTFSFS